MVFQMSKQLNEIHAQIRILENQIQELRLVEIMKVLASIKARHKSRRIVLLEEELSLRMRIQHNDKVILNDLLDQLEILTNI